MKTTAVPSPQRRRLLLSGLSLPWMSACGGSGTDTRTSDSKSRSFNYFSFTGTVLGGMPYPKQRRLLEMPLDVLVATPGRLIDFIDQGKVDFSRLELLVLDEADRMLDMGFIKPVEKIAAATPGDRQTLLFSATFPHEQSTEGLAIMTRGVMRDPVSVKVEETHDATTIEQHFYAVANDDARFAALKQLLLATRPTTSVVFCNTKRETQELAEALNREGFSALALHGDLEQRERDQVIAQLAHQYRGGQRGVVDLAAAHPADVELVPGGEQRFEKQFGIGHALIRPLIVRGLCVVKAIDHHALFAGAFAQLGHFRRARAQARAQHKVAALQRDHAKLMAALALENAQLYATALAELEVRTT